MASRVKPIRALARQLLKLSVVDGVVSPERVAGVLAYLEKSRPANQVPVLKAYRRLIAVEIAKSEAIVEHAGPVTSQALDAIASDLSRKYGRRVTAIARPNPALLAGLRVHVGDDTYEASVAGQLSALAAAV
jgi:F-type H+-transporting ATPase subunit delta